ncbi:TPA: hypothetical protein NHP23_002414 [Pseudomonas aeruginosa]|nr:hypothetical protein [Pseudomonas aeruginosa]
MKGMICPLPSAALRPMVMVASAIDLQAPHAGRRWWREVVDSETQVQGYGCCRS